jgi:hypothetical protein
MREGFGATRAAEALLRRAVRCASDLAASGGLGASRSLSNLESTSESTAAAYSALTCETLCECAEFWDMSCNSRWLRMGVDGSRDASCASDWLILRDVMDASCEPGGAWLSLRDGDRVALSQVGSVSEGGFGRGEARVGGELGGGGAASCSDERARWRAARDGEVDGDVAASWNDDRAWRAARDGEVDGGLAASWNDDRAWRAARDGEVDGDVAASWNDDRARRAARDGEVDGGVAASWNDDRAWRAARDGEVDGGLDASWNDDRAWRAARDGEVDGGVAASWHDDLDGRALMGGDGTRMRTRGESPTEALDGTLNSPSTRTDDVEPSAEVRRARVSELFEWSDAGSLSAGAAPISSSRERLYSCPHSSEATEGATVGTAFASTLGLGSPSRRVRGEDEAGDLPIGKVGNRIT